MRILVIHTQLWAHYKSVVFSEIQSEIEANYPNSTFLVGQIALHEQSRVDMADTGVTMVYKYPYQVLFPTNLDSVSFSQRLNALLQLYRSFRPDVLNITGYFDMAQVLVMFYAKARGAKIVISSESSQVDRNRSYFKETIKKLILKQADAFFCFGSTTVNYLKALSVPEAKIPVQKAAVVDNERIAKAFAKARDEKFTQQNANRSRAFIYVGRFAPEKNLLGLLASFALCLSEPEGTGWQLILVGDGPQRKELEEYIISHQLSPIVTFTGAVVWDKVPEYLAAADVLVLPSFSEPWGLVVNEAMVCGMPVIVSNRCGCLDDLVREEKNGYSFDPYDVTDLYEKMRYYQINSSKILNHGKISKEIISAYTPALTASEMVQCYHRLSS